MFDKPPFNFTDDLAEHLAQKTGFSTEQARTFLDALQELLTAKEEASQILPSAHEFCFPLVENEEGTMVVDTTDLYAGFQFPKIRKPPAQQPPVPGQPAKPPDKPRRPPGGYPGPSVYIVIDNPEDTHLKLDKIDLGNLSEALTKAKRSSSLEDMLRSYRGDYEKLEEK